jgi:hypothetical protein
VPMVPDARGHAVEAPHLWAVPAPAGERPEDHADGYWYRALCAMTRDGRLQDVHVTHRREAWTDYRPRNSSTLP